MTKIERLNTRVEKLLVAAVHEVLEVVKETVLEYQEKTARTQRENESLRRRLRELQDKQKRSPGSLLLTSANVSLGEIAVGQASSCTLAGERKELSEQSKPEPGDPAEWDYVSATVETEGDHNHMVAAATPLEFDCILLADQIKKESEHATPCTDQTPLYCANSSNFSQPEAAVEHQGAGAGYKFMYVPPDGNALERRYPSDKSRPAADVHVERLQCLMCGKSFAGTASLRMHQRCHTGDKPYRCQQCGRCFSHAGDFKKHKRVHTGEKPYFCTVCGKSFSQSGYLKIHLRYHTGERPYCCTQCGKSFSHSSNLKKHLQIHTA